MTEKIKIGCIADDFTGASDAASFLVKAGMRTILFNGVPREELRESCDAVVIALKTRSARTDRAVADSLAGVEWLKRQGTAQYYSKYCSTFDSTPKGNIGPILDAMLETLQVRSSVLCPALPVNGRTVRDGILYVNGVPLADSPMKNHPLNPMWESDIAKLMEPQSKYPCLKVSVEQMKCGKESVWREIEGKTAGVTHFYLVPDYYEDAHAEWIADIFGESTVLSGGSGILTALGRRAMDGGDTGESLPSAVPGKAVILAGSCSEATRRQIHEYEKDHHRLVKMDPLRLIGGIDQAESYWRQAEDQDGVLIYSSDSPEEVEKVQKAVGNSASEHLEKTTAELALLARKEGYTRFIVAGGETSGAVTQALGYDAYWIGSSVAPGVPIMMPLGHPEIRLILKSGNFGQPDFFFRAVEMTGEHKEHGNG